MSQQHSDEYRFVTADEITSLGVLPGTNCLSETIGDHAVKILQEHEQYLTRINGYGEKFDAVVNESMPA